MSFTSCLDNNDLIDSKNKKETETESALKKVENNEEVISFNKVEKYQLIETKDGVVLFFSFNDNYYQDAISIIPHNYKEKKQLVTFLQNNTLSFEYKLNGIHFFNSNGGSLYFVVNNKKGVEYAKNLKTKASIYYCNQLAFAKGNIFKYNSEINKTDKKTNIFVNSILGRVDASGVKCASGGAGSTSCGVGDTWSHCSVTCGTGYYACCQSDGNTCHCIKEN